MSGEHALLRRAGGHRHIHDLHGRNGVFVAGRRLAHDERLTFDPGAEIGLGPRTPMSAPLQRGATVAIHADCRHIGLLVMTRSSESWAGAGRAMGARPPIVIAGAAGAARR